MAFSVSPHNSQPILNPPSSFSFLSPQSHIQFLPFSKPLIFRPCRSQNTTQTDTNQPQRTKIEFEVQKKKQKTKPSFYEQIRQKWSVKPLTQTKEFPWQQQEHPRFEPHEDPPVNFNLESPKCFVELDSERNEDHRSSKSSTSDNSLLSSSFSEENKPIKPQFGYQMKTDQNSCGKHDNIRELCEDLPNNLTVEEVKSGHVKVEVATGTMQEDKMTLFATKSDVHTDASLSGKLDNHARNMSDFEDSAKDSCLNRSPWVEEEREKRSKMDLAEKTIPEHELKRLRNVALRMKERIKVGAAGVTQTLVDTIHEKWQIDEVVKLKFEGPSMLNMKRIHGTLESRTGGIVIWRSGSSVVLYRGLTYKLGCVKTYVKEKAVNSDISPHSERLIPVSMIPPKDFSEEELMEMSEINSMLEDIGPRYIDWSGPPPLPVDADLLPAMVPGYKTPFRLLPYGVRLSLKDVEMTHFRRLARTMRPHFALGRSRELQGLAAAMVKLWQKSAVAKIAIKRGVLNTNNERMAEELKRLTGGTLLSRNKEYIVFYRGNDFLPPVVTEALKERERLALHQYQEEEARRYASSLITSNSKNYEIPLVAGSLAETLAATSRWGKQPSSEDVEKMMKDSTVKKYAALVKYTEQKLAIANWKLKKAERALAKVQESLEPEDLPTDLETITDEERLIFRKMGLSMKPYLLLGRRDVFDGTIQNMHLHWKFRELVKIIVRGKRIAQVKHIAISLEAESSGILVSIDLTTKGYAIIMYRGKNYQRPLIMRPRNLLTKRQALARSIELQRREGLKHHISSLQEELELLKSGLEDMKDGKEIDSTAFYERMGDTSIPSDDDMEEDEGEEAYLQTYDSGDDNGSA